MSSLSWLTSLKCSPSIISDDSSSFEIVQHWLEFIFLSPCPQRIIFSAINLVFLFTLIVLALKRLYSRFLIGRNTGSSVLDKPLLGDNSPGFRITFWFRVCYVVTALLALVYSVLSILAIKSQWNLVEILFKLLQAMTNVVILVLITHEKKFGAVSHPLPLRIYWMMSFSVVSLFTATAITRLVSNSENADPDITMDDIFSVSSFPLYMFLFITAVRNSSGISLNFKKMLMRIQDKK
ncbi:hypothetical protein DH2020_004543 [Rehmannia glutinosa]|uniref:Uncharacterized protein n=1 Tax=Rehmannia glutinosa TaxID=99300 RepID=A0ABR0XPS8_REHGL